MDESITAGGDWGPAVWLDQDGATAQNGPQVQASSVALQSTVSDGPDRWSSFFQNVGGAVINYAIAKDAKANGIRTATGANGQPVYGAAAGGGNILVLTALVVGAVLLAKKG
jgi:hypothetical protein